VNDFLSRLIARSSGERSPVRPAIVPAFTPEAGGAGRDPAGEVLKNPAEHLPAIAPLPFETLYGKERPNGVQPSPNPQSGKMDSPVPQQSSALKNNARPFEAAEGREERQVGEQNRATFETNVAATASPLAPRPDVPGRESVELPRTSIFEAQDPATIAVRREIKPSPENATEKLVVPAAPPQPPVFAARLAAERTSELSVENWRKKKPSEPIVQVTIGRIEVRASIAAPKSAEKKTPNGVMSLEEYQRVRNRRSAG